MSNKKTKQPMRKAQRWLTEEGLILINGWARIGLTNKEIAEKMGINVSSLYTWRKRFPEIDKALREGQELVNFKVLNALVKKALQGDTSAMIFWLKNRMSDLFRDQTFRRLNEAQTEKTKAETAKVKADTEMTKAKTKLLGGHNDQAHQAKLDKYLNELDAVLEEAVNEDKQSTNTQSNADSETTDRPLSSVHES